MPDKAVNGVRVPMTVQDIAERDVRDAAWAAAATDRAVDTIRAEAERRIAAGLVLSSGVRFRCDDQSIARLTGMASSTVWPKTFKTQDGITVTLDNQVQAQAVFAECDAYITAVLAASATLQDAPPVDPTADVHWPGDGSV